MKRSKSAFPSKVIMANYQLMKAFDDCLLWIHVLYIAVSSALSWNFVDIFPIMTSPFFMTVYKLQPKLK